ncbi:MAG: tetratricopeptide repeat protein [Proteobacteria bacterium]|nr:MAG: tetratricopeptide repeat protein [Pseudomonadota bacterium]
MQGMVLLMFLLGSNVQKKGPASIPAKPATTFSIQRYTDSLETNLSPSQSAFLSSIKKDLPQDSASRAAKFHEIARFWRDSLKAFEPFAYYTSEASKLENSEKSLTFAAHLMLDNLRMQQNEAVLGWHSNETIDLFKRALIFNPESDDLRIGLGSAYIYGEGRAGNAEETMKGIQEILAVANKDTTNMKAQLVLGVGGMVSGQFDKARDRFLKVVANQPNNLEAIAYLADTYAALGEKQEAIKWYNISKKLADNAHYSREVDERIRQLK